MIIRVIMIQRKVMCANTEVLYGAKTKQRQVHIYTILTTLAWYRYQQEQLAIYRKSKPRRDKGRTAINPVCTGTNRRGKRRAKVRRRGVSVFVNSRATDKNR